MTYRNDDDMQVTRSSKAGLSISFIVKGIMIVVVIILISLGAIQFLGGDSNPREIQIQLSFEQYKTATIRYQSIISTFDGVCTSIGLPSDVGCYAKGDVFKMQKKLEEGGYYCIDHLGFTGRLDQSTVSVVGCQ